MKRTGLILVVVFLPIFLLVSYCSGIGKLAYDKQLECLPADTPGLQEFQATSLTGAGLTVKGAKPTVEQSKNIQLLASLAKSETEHPIEAFLALYIGATQEATMRSVGYGYPESTSLGLWQQIAAWGPSSVRLNARASTMMFLTGGRAGQSGLLDYPEWWKNSPGQAVQNVQRSNPSLSRDPVIANREAVKAYEKHLPEAKAWAKKLLGSSGSSGYSGVQTTSVVNLETGSTPVECENADEVDRIEQMVKAAEKMVGLTGDDEDVSGTKFVAKAAKEGDITLPGSFEKLLAFDGNADEGVSAQLLDSAGIKRDEGLKRGDIVFYNSGGKKHAAIYAGSSGGLIRIATMNVLGSNHYAPVGWSERLKRTIAEFESNDVDVVGVQELRPNQRKALSQWLTRKGWGIYPDSPVYRNRQGGAKSVNSIIWDDNRFEKVDERSLLMPCYFEGCKVKKPAVLLRERSSGDEFWVITTHDPAHARNTEKRLSNWRKHPVQMQSLFQETGKPVLLVGDFNSNMNVMYKGGNVTPGKVRSNLAYCVITASGDITHAADIWKGRSGCSPETSRDRSLRSIDHIFATEGVKVSYYRVLNKPRYANGADHPLVIADIALENTVTSRSGQMVTSDGAQAKISSLKMPTRISSVLRLTATDIVPVSSAVGGSGKWTFPMKKGAYLYRSNSYGPRIHPVTGRADFHNGTDFSAACGTKLVAMNTGKVVQAKYSGAWGNYVIIDYGKIMSLYAHMPDVPRDIREGATVKSGQQVGVVGTTGLSTGCHLHLTMGDSLKMLYGDKIGTVDPVPFLASVGIKP